MSHKWLQAQRRVFFDAVYSRMWNWVRLPIRNSIFFQFPRLPLHKERLQFLAKLLKVEWKSRSIWDFPKRKSSESHHACMVGRVVMEFDVINVSKQNLSGAQPPLNAPFFRAFQRSRGFLRGKADFPPMKLQFSSEQTMSLQGAFRRLTFGSSDFVNLFCQYSPWCHVCQ